MNTTRILIKILLLFPVILGAQSKEGLDLIDSLPRNPGITYGQLENGFKYYLYTDSSINSDQVLMEFVVNAGTNDEEVDQIHLAHAIEHIPFLTTKHFPNGLQTGLEIPNLGMTSSDFGATTSNITRYHFNFPIGKLEALGTGLLWFRDIAGNLDFKMDIIEKVSKEIYAESLYSGYILVDQLESKYLAKWHKSFPFKDCKDPSQCMPNYTPKSFEKYYNNWYRPDNMALIIIGNMDVSEEFIIKSIESKFSDLKNPSNSIPRENRYSKKEYLQSDNNIIAISNKDLTEDRIMLYLRQDPMEIIKTKEDYRAFILNKILGNLVAKRLFMANHQYNNPITVLSAKFSQYPPAFTIAMSKSESASLQLGLETAISEMTRIRQHGFSISELEEAQNEIIQKYISGKDQRDKFILEECINNFSRGTAFPINNPSLVRQLITSVTVKDINDLFNNLFGPKSPMDIALLSKKEIKLDKDAVFKSNEKIWKTKKKPYKPIVAPLSLMDAKLLETLSEKHYQIRQSSDMGIYELFLENKAKVILKSFKPLGSNSDKVMLYAFSPRGASQYSGKDYFSALNAGSIVHNSGVNGLDKFSLSKYSEGKKMILYPYIGHNEATLEGSTLKSDVEPLLQLVHLYFTKPNRNEDAFKDWKDNQHNLMVRLKNDRILEDTIASILKIPDHISHQTHMEGLDQTELKRAFKIFQECFSNTGDFTFIITGDFEISEMVSLVNKYLGSIPRQNKLESSLIENYSNREESNRFDIRSKIKGALVNLCYVTDIEYSIENEITLNVLQTLLKSILKKRLRYQESGVYSARVRYKSYNPANWNRTEIIFECAIDDIEKLIRATLEEIDLLKKNSVDMKEFKNAIKIIKDYYARREAKNELVLKDLLKQYRINENPENLKKRKGYLDLLTPNKIQKVSKKIFEQKYPYIFVIKDSIS